MIARSANRKLFYEFLSEAKINIRAWKFGTVHFCLDGAIAALSSYALECGKPLKVETRHPTEVRFELMENALRQLRIEIEPLAKQIICPSDNTFQRQLNLIDGALASPKTVSEVEI